jgi:hypothetical protein
MSLAHVKRFICGKKAWASADYPHFERDRDGVDVYKGSSAVAVGQDPPIDGREGVRVTVLEECEPAPEDRIDELNELFETVSVRSACPLSDGILELSQLFLRR